MKKIFLLLSIVSVFGLTGCNNDDDRVDSDTIGRTIDKTVSLVYNANTLKYNNLLILDSPMFDSDVVLVYRKTTDDEGFTVFQQIPRTLYLANGQELDYDFNFTANDILLTADANFDLSTAPQFTQNQTYRIVLVPSDFAANLSNNDYDTVMSAIKEANNGVPTQIKTIK